MVVDGGERVIRCVEGSGEGSWRDGMGWGWDGWARAPVRTLPGQGGAGSWLCAVDDLFTGCSPSPKRLLYGQPSAWLVVHSLCAVPSTSNNVLHINPYIYRTIEHGCELLR